jgi:hypothetical protein
MKYSLSTIPFPSVHTFIEKYGDMIWDEICDEITEDRFRPVEIINRITTLNRFKPKQRIRYLRAILASVAYECRHIRSMPYAVTQLTPNLYAWGDGTED